MRICLCLTALFAALLFNTPAHAQFAACDAEKSTAVWTMNQNIIPIAEAASFFSQYQAPKIRRETLPAWQLANWRCDFRSGHSITAKWEYEFDKRCANSNVGYVAIWYDGRSMGSHIIGDYCDNNFNTLTLVFWKSGTTIFCFETTKQKILDEQLTANVANRRGFDISNLDELVTYCEPHDLPDASTKQDPDFTPGYTFEESLPTSPLRFRIEKGGDVAACNFIKNRLDGNARDKLADKTLPVEWQRHLNPDPLEEIRKKLGAKDPFPEYRRQMGHFDYRRAAIDLNKDGQAEVLIEVHDFYQYRSATFWYLFPAGSPWLSVDVVKKEDLGLSTISGDGHEYMTLGVFSIVAIDGEIYLFSAAEEPEKERRIVTHSLYRPFDDEAVCEIQPIVLD